MNQTLPRVVVLHGTHGGPDINWFPLLDDQLRRQGIEVLRPRFPTPQWQSLAAWFGVFDAAVEPLAPRNMILVGHSLGAAMALRLVECANRQFDGLFLTAAFIGALGLPDYDPINASFFAGPFDWPGICERMGLCHCWAGDDDPYVPLPQSRELAAVSTHRWRWSRKVGT